MTRAVRIIQGDALTRLRNMPSESVHCCVTSPPYWGLRDYQVTGQIGMESTLAEHIRALVVVFDEVRRVLRPDGTLWLNYGDCYATTPNGRSAAATKAISRDDRTFRDKPFSTIGGSLKPKDLCMAGNRLAIALQEAGWFVRSEIIWHKPNPMPESASDRPTCAHEKVWLLTRSERYFFDADAIREPPSAALIKQVEDGYGGADTKDFAGARAQSASGTKQRIIENARKKIDKQRGHSRRHAGFNDRWDALSRDEQMALGSNARNVWTIATKPYHGAHFATMPPELAARCVTAGCPEGGVVLDPFAGAGTTAVAAKALGRRAVLIELSPDYCAMARKRLAAAKFDWKAA